MLLGFIFMTILAGIFVERFIGKRYLIIIGMILATAIAYIFGTAWLAFQMELPFTAVLSIGVIPYLPGDTAKRAPVGEKGSGRAGRRWSWSCAADCGRA